MNSSGAQALVRFLERAGVEYVFGTCGHTVLALLDALKDSKIEFISVPHEQMAVHAADCYYRVSHKPGVVLTTLGPGLGNTVTGLMDAIEDCSAVILITGNVPSSYEGRESFQELAVHADANQLDVLRPVVKRAWHVSDPHSLTFSLARAFNVAVSGRPGPVAVDIAMDVFTYTTEYADVDASVRQARGRSRADSEETRRAVELLIQARRPVIFAGGGTLIAEATPELLALAEHLALPVTTSMIGQGAIPNDHPLFAGFTGSVGTPTAHQLVQEADVALAIGTRFSEMDCNSWNPDYFLPIPDRCKLIHIDIEPSEIGRIYPTEVGLVGDAKAILAEMVELARARVPAVDVDTHTRTEELDRARQEWFAGLEPLYELDDPPFEAAAVVAAVRRAMPRDGILLTGVGVRHLVGQHFSVLEPQTHIVASGNGTMGLSIPGAFGARLGAPERAVVSLTGDGEFRALPSSLAVAVEYSIPAVWVVLNNGGFRSISLYQERHYNRQYGTSFVVEPGGEESPLDWMALAQSFGVEAYRADRGETLVATLEKAIHSGAPALVEVPVKEKSRIFASGNWEANRFLKPGWNE